MSRIQFKLWEAPLATLQQPYPTGLAEGEVAIAAESGAIFKRPDNQPVAPLVQVGLPDLGAGFAVDPATGKIIISAESLAQVLTPASIGDVLTPEVLAAALTPEAVLAAIPVAGPNQAGLVKPGNQFTIDANGFLVYNGGGGGAGGAADTAAKLLTARAIQLTGDVTGAVQFDGSIDVAIVTHIDQAAIAAAVSSAQAGAALTEVSYTANTTLQASDIGKLINNIGATAAVQLQLPSASAVGFKGASFEVAKVVDQTIGFKAAAGQFIMDSSAGGTLTNSTGGELLSTVKIRSTNCGGGVYKWAIVAGFGTWTTA
jgi:hypothetical protein